jgi:two-component system copper resistance phosphate regulon response regulator CusR
MRVLLVEDDEVIAEQIAEALRRERYAVDVAADGEEGSDMAAMNTYGLVVLDIMLPFKDGWSICREIRERRDPVPVLMLTARDSVDDRIKGLEGGADDYLPKPFDIRELLARIKALVRRDKIHRTGVIRIVDLEIDANAHVARRAGDDLKLTPREFSLLEALARNEGRTLTRQVIMESVWNNEESLENSVNFHVTSLRKKVDAPYKIKLIHTVHGLGYTLKAS